MSVQTQIDRISGNVSAALSAIARKGVTVPDGSTSDALAGLIASIETGGGMKVCCGTFTPVENTVTYTVEHDLLKMPRIYCYMLSTNAYKGITDEAKPTHRFIIGCDFWDNGSLVIVSKTSGFPFVMRPSYVEFKDNDYISSISENSITFGNSILNTDYNIFKANTEYMWFVAG